MPKIKNVFFVVSIVQDGRRLYFVRSELKRESNLCDNEGIFSSDFAMAKKFKERFWAELTASYFEGAVVERCKSGEKLKGGC